MLPQWSDGRKQNSGLSSIELAGMLLDIALKEAKYQHTLSLKTVSSPHLPPIPTSIPTHHVCRTPSLSYIGTCLERVFRCLGRTRRLEHKSWHSLLGDCISLSCSVLSFSCYPHHLPHRNPGLTIMYVSKLVDVCWSTNVCSRMHGLF